jgi:hypothetical protein
VPTALTFIEVALVCLLAIVMLAVVVVYARRQAIGRGRVLFMCGWRPAETDTFIPGFASLDGGSLAWFRHNSLSLRASRRWRRPQLEFSSAAAVDAPELASILSRPFTVRCRYEGEDFDLAMSAASYSALRSWVESMPPGHNVNVA